MSGALLEVICLHAADARRAEEGGADRVELLGSLDDGGMSPEPSLVEEVRDAVGVQLRVMLRLRPGFGTDGAEAVRLRGLAASYVDAGADGLVLGFLNGHSEVDASVVEAITADSDWPWTFHRAIDQALDPRRAWRTLLGLPNLDQVLTAGSSRGVAHGLDELIALAGSDPRIAKLIMAGGGLAPEHVPWLARAGVQAFHIGAPARPGRSYRAYVDADLVRTWKTLVDDSVTRAADQGRSG
ncbi:copper homeostasis protein CutC [Naumannella huperziae]